MIDLNKRVENPALVSALAHHFQTKSNASAAVLFEELMKAVFLLGIIAEPPITPGQDSFPPGAKIAIFEVGDSNGVRLLALFTDHGELSKFSTEANATLVMPTAQVFDFALDKKFYTGVVVNPASPYAVRLDSEFIKTLKAPT